MRRRALAALGAVRSDIAQQWIPHIRRMLGDGDAGVRAAAIGALSSISQEDAASFARPLLADPDPRIRATAAVAMAAQLARRGRRSRRIDAGRSRQRHQGFGTRPRAATSRSRSARSPIRGSAVCSSRSCTIRRPKSPTRPWRASTKRDVQASTTSSSCPRSSSLLRNRRLKGRARAALVGYGEPVVDSLAFFLRDQEEDIWVRRHIPGTLAQIPSQKTMDVLVAALAERDGFIRYKVVSALERLRREHPELTLNGESIEKLAIQEARRYFNFLSLHDEPVRQGEAGGRLAAVAGAPRADDAAAQPDLQAADAPLSAGRHRRGTMDARARRLAWTRRARRSISTTSSRARSASRSCPCSKTCRGTSGCGAATSILKTRPRDVEETLLQLINDDDPVTAAAAIDVVRERRRCGASPTTSSTCSRIGT